MSVVSGQRCERLFKTFECSATGQQSFVVLLQFIVEQSRLINKLVG